MKRSFIFSCIFSCIIVTGLFASGFEAQIPQMAQALAAGALAVASAVATKVSGITNPAKSEPQQTCTQASPKQQALLAPRAVAPTSSQDYAVPSIPRMPPEIPARQPKSAASPAVHPAAHLALAAVAQQKLQTQQQAQAVPIARSENAAQASGVVRSSVSSAHVYPQTPDYDRARQQAAQKRLQNNPLVQKNEPVAVQNSSMPQRYIKPRVSLETPRAAVKALLFKDITDLFYPCFEHAKMGNPKEMIRCRILIAQYQCHASNTKAYNKALSKVFNDWFDAQGNLKPLSINGSLDLPYIFSKALHQISCTLTSPQDRVDTDLGKKSYTPYNQYLLQIIELDDQDQLFANINFIKNSQYFYGVAKFLYEYFVHLHFSKILDSSLLQHDPEFKDLQISNKGNFSVAQKEYLLVRYIHTLQGLQAALNELELFHENDNDGPDTSLGYDN
jgi:hypothetical protein